MEDKKTFYITTPLYYVNDVPHIGHAYTTILADTMIRFKKLLGEEAFMLTGTDEHGTKVAEAAAKVNKSPQDFVNQIVKKFTDTWKKLEIKYDHFIRTTDKYHVEVV